MDIKINRAMSNEALWLLLWLAREGLDGKPNDAELEAARAERHRRFLTVRGRFKQGRLSRRAEYKLSEFIRREEAFYAGCAAAYLHATKNRAALMARLDGLHAEYALVMERIDAIEKERADAERLYEEAEDLLRTTSLRLVRGGKA